MPRMPAILTSDSKPEQISADRCIRNCDRWRTWLWPNWIKEKRIVEFYNGGSIPLDDDEADDEAPVSIGLGYRYIARPFQILLDSILMNPGFIKSDIQFPRDPKRKRVVESALDQVANELIHKRSESLLRGLAGRALVTGRAFAYRLSRWDWKFKQGRLLHDIEDCDDIYDSSFREWAFMGRMTLRELDERISNTRDVGTGWNRQAMKSLKEWILKTTSDEKTKGGNLSPTNWAEQVLMPFDATMAHRPLDVYWYFRKNGTHNDVTGQENIDLYCVSRWGVAMSVQTIDNNDGSVSKYLDLSSDAAENKTMYYLKDAFGSIEECLIDLLLDSRVDGDQEMAQVSGTGQIMVNRLLPMEQIAISTIDGIAWASQPNWTAAQPIDEARMKDIARNGLGSWDFVPQGVTTVPKNNAITGLNGAMEMLRMLGMSADQDAATGEISAMDDRQPQLKSLANQLVNQVAAGASRRSAKFFSCLDRLANQQLSTVCRPKAYWMPGDAAFRDVTYLQGKLLVQYQVSPDEYSSTIIRGKCRRLAMDGDKQQTITTAAGFIQQFGGQISPEGHHFLAKEAARAAYGDPTADMLLPDEPKLDLMQQMVILGQEAMCLQSLQAPKRNPSDNPILHVISHMKTLANRIQVAQQQGSWTPLESQGVQLLLQHAAMDAPGLPKQELQQVGQGLQQMARVVASLPVTGATSELQLKEADAQRKQQETNLKIEREHNLQTDREQKIQIDKQQALLKIHDQNEKDKTGAAQRAATLSQAASNLPALPAPGDSAMPPPSVPGGVVAPPAQPLPGA